MIFKKRLSFHSPPFASLSVVFFSLCVVSCIHSKYPAPVVEGWRHGASAKSDYVVKNGDTIYSIAWAFDQDYHALVVWNALKIPYSIYSGQRLKMHGPALRFPAAASRDSNKMTPSFLSPSMNNSAFFFWTWPLKAARIIHPFTPETKGIDFAAAPGTAVHSAAAGDVVYAGEGVKGYGKLILVKHNATDLTAYAYNATLLVREGQRVQAGQRIATVGRKPAGSYCLHFEIRRNGKPLDPKKVLPDGSVRKQRSEFPCQWNQKRIQWMMKRYT